MSGETALCFGPFRLDLPNERVWRGQEACKLGRKAFAVLHYLVDHPGQLVTKEALFTAIWPQVVVGDAALAVCVRELRQILGDTSKPSQYIETVYGRGYRFIGKVVSSQHSGVSSLSSFPAPSSQHPAPTLVGRETELAQLHDWLAKALSGQRQVVFVMGEPGIGKTTVMDAFLQSLASRVQSRNEAKVTKKIKR
jgi:DNA-binding winged helix-turn-helix (wHTH) protein